MEGDALGRLGMEVEADGDPVVLVLSGELDPQTAPALAEQVDTAWDGATDLVLDLARVRFIDSAGVRTIVELHGRLDRAGKQLRLRALSDMAQRVVEIAGLDEHLNID